jgi:hypothetical protein
MSSGHTSSRHDGYASIREALAEGGRNIRYLSSGQAPGGRLRVLHPSATALHPIPDALGAPLPAKAAAAPATAGVGASASASAPLAGVRGGGGGGGGVVSGGGGAAPDLHTIAHTAAHFLTRTSAAAAATRKATGELTGSDPSLKAWDAASKSSRRVTNALARVGLEAPLPTVDHLGHVTVYTQRLAPVFEESTRYARPLAEFRTAKTGPAEAVSLPRMRAAQVFDVGGMGATTYVRLAPPVPAQESTFVVFDKHGRPQPPPAPLTVSHADLVVAAAAAAAPGTNQRLDSALAAQLRPVAPTGDGGGLADGGGGHGGAAAAAAPHIPGDPLSDAAFHAAIHPPKLSERMLRGAHVHAVVPMTVAATHPNPVYRVAPRMADFGGTGSGTSSGGHNSLTAQAEAEKEGKASAAAKTVADSADGGGGGGDDGGGGGGGESTAAQDRATEDGLAHLAYSSVGLRAPPRYTPGKGLSAIIETQQVNALAAASKVDAAGARKLAAELAFLGPQLSSGRAVSGILQPVLNRLRPASAAPLSSTMASSRGAGTKASADAASGPPHAAKRKSSVDSDGSADTETRALARRIHVLAAEAKRDNPFGVPPDVVRDHARAASSNVVVRGGQVRVGGVFLDPGQANALASLQKSDAPLATALVAVIKNTAMKESRLAASRAAFDATSARAAVAANDSVAAYTYRLIQSRAHRFNAVDGVMDLAAAAAAEAAVADAAEDAAFAAAAAAAAAAAGAEFGADVRRDSLLEIRPHHHHHGQGGRGLGSSADTIQHVNLGSAAESVTAMRMLTVRESLLDEADALDTLSELVDATIEARPAGLTGLERTFLRLLAGAAGAATPLTHAFAFRLLENMHKAALSLTAAELAPDMAAAAAAAAAASAGDTAAALAQFLPPRSPSSPGAASPAGGGGGLASARMPEDDARGLTPPDDAALSEFSPGRRRLLRRERDREREEEAERAKKNAADAAAASAAAAAAAKKAGSAAAAPPPPAVAAPTPAAPERKALFSSPGGSRRASAVGEGGGGPGRRLSSAADGPGASLLAARRASTLLADLQDSGAQGGARLLFQSGGPPLDDSDDEDGGDSGEGKDEDEEEKKREVDDDDDENDDDGDMRLAGETAASAARRQSSASSFRGALLPPSATRGGDQRPVSSSHPLHFDLTGLALRATQQQVSASRPTTAQSVFDRLSRPTAQRPGTAASSTGGGGRGSRGGAGRPSSPDGPPSPSSLPQGSPGASLARPPSRPGTAATRGGRASSPSAPRPGTSTGSRRGSHAASDAAGGGGDPRLGGGLEPLAHMPVPLLTASERAARAARRTWPLLLHRPISRLLDVARVSAAEYEAWLEERGLVFPTAEAAQAIDARERLRAIKEIAAMEMAAKGL